MPTEQKVVVFVEVETSPSPYFTAEQARMTAEKIRSEEVERVFKDLIGVIEEFANKGKLNVRCTRDLEFGEATRSAVAKKLESLGYTVKTEYTSSMSVFIINW